MMSDTERIVRDWEDTRRHNAYLSRGYTGQQVKEHWDSVSPKYTGSVYDGSRMMMFADLEDMGLISADKDFIDIGCGPGLYDLVFAKYLKEIVCVDGSDGMLSRLRRECRRTNISNISTVSCLWEEFSTDRRFDIVYSSMCPAVYNPESFMKMESLSRGHCVYITWDSRCNDINSEIWKRLDTDFRPGGMPIDHPYLYLRSLGREPVVRKYFKNTVIESDPDELLQSEVSYFSGFTEMDDDKREMISDVIGSHTEDGIVREERGSVLSMMVWEPE